MIRSSQTVIPGRTCRTPQAENGSGAQTVITLCNVALGVATAFLRITGRDSRCCVHIFFLELTAASGVDAMHNL